MAKKKEADHKRKAKADRVERERKMERKMEKKRGRKRK